MLSSGSNNEINVRLDLNTKAGVAALQALAAAFGGKASAPMTDTMFDDGGRSPVAPSGNAGPATNMAPAASPSDDIDERPAPSAPAAEEAEEAPAVEVRRRRRKAEIEEDVAAGKDEEFKKLAKTLPDASVEEIRARLYATEPEAAPEPAAEVESDPDWASPAVTEAFEAPAPAADDDWAPSW